MSLVNSLWVKFFCKQVGVDQFGNTYYLGSRKNYLGKAKRYVLYNGIDDGSKIPAIWHSWLHYLSNDLPNKNLQEKYDWQIDHIQNLTGSKMAYDPSLNNTAKKLESYSKWMPNK